MNNAQRPETRDDEDQDKASRGVNLWVVYGLMALGLLVAIGLAMMIVLPFYQHRH